LERPEESEPAVLRNDERIFHEGAKGVRSGGRLNSRVKVAVEWTEGKVTHRAEGYTVNISPKGCLAIAPQGFPVGHRMKLVNLANHKEAEAVLIWRGHEGREGWELGLELQNPPVDYWGVEF